jgi:hypothetical protein
MIPFLGIGLSMLSFLALAGMAARALVSGVPFPGFGTIVCLMLMLFGLLFLMLGIVTEYIGMTYVEARHRPPFIVSRRHGFQPGDAAGPIFAPSASPDPSAQDVSATVVPTDRKSIPGRRPTLA